ncbi:hypothetical protein GCM10011611_50850 [Aliidongia dinghuensis]|uniref:Uncharacterized protein n=1 Tax=Aliidongia dinghuensis TaxID=1867774 RepID=A0A8J3E4F4_9PROT|nr:hypothetical protein [Aliidongia dinghuensis]GGF38303.1 hypothetical protein GCM10011611_50850 [Aliidongia dinghuensis]
MNNVALAFAPRALRPVRTAAARKPVRARALRTASRPAALAPSAGSRVEALLMGVTFLALAGLAIVAEAAGVAAALVG